ncbi:FGGY-family carbohydrate kinase [uncultured Roseobacter sp.]|uniref:FGGY-family carbohydrate kinase n=1 Tax=uncultured Roseobacter sp. TaxID=114847 RepID=UPI002613D731|nr:FGGY-family carbohydrate kinase [uncultured Roseobacter sp.]
MSRDLIIGIDAGTSVIKSVAFDLAGRQLAVASVPNRYNTDTTGAVTQSLAQTWQDCVTSMAQLAEMLPDLAGRTDAIAVTGQGDGTWLVGSNNQPVGDGWLWLDARAGSVAQAMRDTDADEARFLSTGTGLNACQQGVQLTHMMDIAPDQLAQAEVAFHCKDWLYLNLTGVRATDPSEACFTFGDFRTRSYSDEVIGFYGLGDHARLLPPICDGSKTTHALTDEAAARTGLRAGTPVVLGYVDVVCSALGAGAYQAHHPVGCTIVGTTGVHIRATAPEDIVLNAEQRTGYVMIMPVEDVAAHLQTNMASTLNLDWVRGLVGEVAGTLGAEVTEDQLLTLMNDWIATAKPASLLYHPYISDAGERGPFIDHTARSSFIGLTSAHGFGDLMRATAEGLGLAARDCYAAMGQTPNEVRLTGGAARSRTLRDIFSAALGVPVRQSLREEAGAAGAAMMAAVAIGAYEDMAHCLADWVTPLLGESETPDRELTALYDQLFPNYTAARKALQPVWHGLAHREDL